MEIIFLNLKGIENYYYYYLNLYAVIEWKS